MTCSELLPVPWRIWAELDGVAQLPKPRRCSCRVAKQSLDALKSAPLLLSEKEASSATRKVIAVLYFAMRSDSNRKVLADEGVFALVRTWSRSGRPLQSWWASLLLCRLAPTRSSAASTKLARRERVAETLWCLAASATPRPRYWATVALLAWPAAALGRDAAFWKKMEVALADLDRHELPSFTNTLLDCLRASALSGAPLHSLLRVLMPYLTRASTRQKAAHALSTAIDVVMGKSFSWLELLDTLAHTGVLEICMTVELFPFHDFWGSRFAEQISFMLSADPWLSPRLEGLTQYLLSAFAAVDDIEVASCIMENLLLVVAYNERQELARLVAAHDATLQRLLRFVEGAWASRALPESNLVAEDLIDLVASDMRGGAPVQPQRA